MLEVTNWSVCVCLLVCFFFLQIYNNMVNSLLGVDFDGSHCWFIMKDVTCGSSPASLSHLNLKVILEDSNRRCGIHLSSSRAFRMFYIIVLVLADGLALPVGPKSITVVVGPLYLTMIIT